MAASFSPGEGLATSSGNSGNAARTIEHIRLKTSSIFAVLSGDRHHLTDALIQASISHHLISDNCQISRSVVNLRRAFRRHGCLNEVTYLTGDVRERFV